ncbi:MAG: GNAT family N-acetyltransferase [Actinomycetota bacterium]
MTAIAHGAKRYWGHDESLISLWRDDLTVTAEFIGSHPVLCAEDEGEIVGFYVLSGADETFELEHMWVHPDNIGRGTGAALFRHAVDTVRELGGSTLRIVSDPNAAGFYLAMGARRVGDAPSRPEGRMLPLLELVIN